MNDIKYVLINLICFLMLSVGSLMSMDQATTDKIQKDIAFAGSEENKVSFSAAIMYPEIAQRESMGIQIDQTLKSMKQSGELDEILGAICLNMGQWKENFKALSDK